MLARLPRRIGVAALLLVWIGAAGQESVYVPPELEAWRGWVLHDQEYRRCPFFHDSNAAMEGSFVCAWPGKLAIDVTAEEGAFEQRWSIFGAEQWLPLPGDESNWPRNVTANGRPATLVSRQGVPTIRMPPGSHRVVGAFAWRERPARLTVPASVGLVELRLDGEQVALPERNDDGLWLGESQRDEAQADALRVEVYRRIEDGVPTLLESVFLIEVAGSVREEVLEPALPSGFTPMALTSALPARWESDGLRLQVRPGQWELTLNARADSALDAVTLPTPQSNLPLAEIWNYQANPRLRATLPEAPRPVDPALVGAEWPELPTFRMEPGEELRIVERSRGRTDAENELHLHRDLWLDFDGGGFTFSDQLSGTMRTDWRLDMAPPYALLAATDGDENLLVTRNQANVGVEVRNANIDVQALGRIDERGETSATGWINPLQSMQATLHLPPGTKLLAAPGVDEAPMSWAGRWRLLDFFLLLVITVATARLFGRVAAVVALLALVPSFHEAGAPIWTWLNLLAAVALARVAPAGRLQSVARSYRLASFALLLLLLVPFALGQIRISLYPQLEPEAHRRGEAWGLFQLLAGQSVDDVAEEMAATGSYIKREAFDAPAPEGARGEEIAEMVVSGVRPPSYRYDHDALVQAGPGKPNWRWTAYPLSWSGPVDARRGMRLLIVPELLTSALRLLAVGALGLLAALFAFDILGKPWRWPQASRLKRTTPSTAALLLAAWALGGSSEARADTPPSDILDELEERLLAPPVCAPRCAEILSADVAASESELAVELLINALATVAVPVPGSDDGWKPMHIATDAAALATHRDEQGTLHIQLNAGRHAVTVRGRLPSAHTVEVAFPARPRTVAVRTEHWLVEGVDDGTLPSGALRLTRRRSETEDPIPANFEASRFPPFVTVERNIRLGLGWEAWTVVRRLAPATGAVTLSIPLLADERLLSGEHTLEDGKVIVALTPTQTELEWHSSLPRQAAMTLLAPQGEPWTEVWTFRVGSTWQAMFDGVPSSEPSRSHTRSTVFHPRPGEALEVTLTRPEAVAGNTLAFDDVRLRTAIGAHQRRTELALAYRSSRGGSHQLGLPSTARLRNVTIDGQTEPLETLDGSLNLPILPGEHLVRVAWDEATAPGLRVATPIVALDAPSSNITSTLEMPSRWLLFATGPSLGPAILYWSELVALIAASLILARLPTPLRTYHWLLLGLGFSTFSWLAFGIVAAWLLAHGARQRQRPDWSRLVYNLSQLGFAALTLAAFAAILTGIPNGLLGNPDMSIGGYQSSAQTLSWFADQTVDRTPEATVWSLPIWTYKALILAWALWLTFALIRWLPWVWQCFAEQGLWQKTPKPQTPAAPPTPDDEEDPWQR